MDSIAMGPWIIVSPPNHQLPCHNDLASSEWLTDRFGGFSGIGQSIALAKLRSELNGVYESVILHPWHKDLSAIVTPCVNLNTFSQFNSNSRS